MSRSVRSIFQKVGCLSETTIQKFRNLDEILRQEKPPNGAIHKANCELNHAFGRPTYPPLGTGNYEE